MPERAKVLVVIYNAIDDLNRTLEAGEKIVKDPDTALFGASSSLDSLELVKLIVAVEERIKEEFGLAVTLADERAMAQARSPFESVDALADYIILLLKEKGRA